MNFSENTMLESLMLTAQTAEAGFVADRFIETDVQSPSRIAFGSCNDQNQQNNLWPQILARRPTAFVWGGDSIYADVELPLDFTTFPPKHALKCATPGRLRKLYRKQRSNPGYKDLIRSNLTIFGTYDDHDYGCNNADRTYAYKQESAEAFVDFIGEEGESPMSRRARDGHGVYGVKLFDFSRPDGHQLVPDHEAALDPDVEWQPSSSLSNRTVAVFVLDCRTHKTPWKTGPSAFQPDYEGDFLGERQWRWLETALSRSRASVNVVLNGLQVHGDRFPDGNLAEAWGKYPLAQQRLYEAMLQNGVEAPLLISGDVHMSQLSRKECHNHKTGGTRSLVEITTSGMTHSWGSSSPPLDDLHAIPTLYQQFERFLAGSLMHLLHMVCPWTELMISDASPDDISLENGGAEGATTGLQYSLEKNFGELEFDWDKQMVSMRVLGEDVDSPPLLSAKWSMDQLSGRASTPGSSLGLEDFQRQRELTKLVDNEWTCANHRGVVTVTQHLFGHVTAGMVFSILLPFPFLLPAYLLLVVLGRYARRSQLSRTSKTGFCVNVSKQAA